jgi:hypothetical protein
VTIEEMVDSSVRPDDLMARIAHRFGRTGGGTP